MKTLDNHQNLISKIKQISPAFPDKEARTVVFCPDDKYIKYFSVALLSLLENNKDQYLDVILLTDNIQCRSQRLILKMASPNVKIRFFKVSQLLGPLLNDVQLLSKDYWSISMYYKCFIPLVMRQYNRVLYCDCDVCITNNFGELFSIKLDSYSMFATLDTISPVLFLERERLYHIRYKLKLKNPMGYFNTGVLLFNIPQIEPLEYWSDFVSILRSRELLFPDQDVLNIIFEGKVKHISCKYNCQYTALRWWPDYLEKVTDEDYKNDFLKARENPIILHYIGNVKPWHAPQSLLAECFWSYARKSPFYEEILYENLQDCRFSTRPFSLILNKEKIYLKGIVAAILSKVTFGETKKRMLQRKERYFGLIREIQSFKL